MDYATLQQKFAAYLRLKKEVDAFNEKNPHPTEDTQIFGRTSGQR